MLSLLMTISLIATAVSGQCLTGNDNPPTMHQGSHVALMDARYIFALDSLKKASHIQPHDNIFFSPHSIHQALTLAFFGSRDNTEASLKKALHIPEELSKIDIQRYYAFEKSVKQQREQNTSDYEYISANKLWMTDKKKLRECMFDFFGDELEKMDFKSNPSAARKQINDWVSNKTKGHIPDLIPNSGITEDTDLVLANAVYFKGLWQSRFDAANTQKDIFYASGSQNAMVNYMRQKKTFNHVVSEELGAHVLELPYKGQQISMYILLPPFATARSMNTVANGMDADGITQLIERLSTEKGSKDLRELLNDGMPSREVEVSLPRFQIERELPITELLKALGAEELLAPNTANLKGFVADGEDTLHLGDAVHRAKIEVTEEGTTAAAATALFSFRSSRPSEPAIFKANHPFIYFIYDKQDDAILFCGVYRLPIPATDDKPPVIA